MTSSGHLRRAFTSLAAAGLLLLLQGAELFHAHAERIGCGVEHADLTAGASGAGGRTLNGADRDDKPAPGNERCLLCRSSRGAASQAPTRVACVPPLDPGTRGSTLSTPALFEDALTGFPIRAPPAQV